MLLALSPAPRPCQRVVSVDLYLAAPDSRREVASGASIYVVRADQRSAHIVSGGMVIQVDLEAINGLVNARALVQRPGGSIRAEFSEEYPCGELTVRRGRVYHRSAVQCDLLEVELGPRQPTSSAEAVLASFMADALPAELFDAGANLPAGRAKGVPGGPSGILHPAPGAVGREADATLFVQVAVAIAGGAGVGSAGAAPGEAGAEVSPRRIGAQR